MAPSIVELVTCAFSVLGGSASQGTNLLPSEAIGGVVGFVKLDGWDLAIRCEIPCQVIAMLFVTSMNFRYTLSC